MKVLNFGSLNIDRSYTVPHFVQAGETLASTEMHTASGGKGLNQSIALARAGLPVWHAGTVGSDGEMLLQELCSSGVDVSCVLRDPVHPTGHAIIQVDSSGQNCILLHGGANRSITEAEVQQILSQFGAGDWLFLQNEISCLDFLIHQAAARGMTVVLNPSPLDEALLSMDLGDIHWLILNEVEGAGITGQTEPEAICTALREKYPHLKIELTLGSQGSLCDDGAEITRQPIFKVNAVDTTAAGDTFTGYFFASILQGKSVAKALERASLASALAVTRPGAAPSSPTAAEVERFAQERGENA